MEAKFSLLFFLTILYNCNGNAPRLGDIFTGAHSVLGGLTHGLNLNIGGHFGLNTKRPPPKKPEETIIVVVEEDNTQPPHGYRPNQNGFNGNHGYSHNGYGPGPNENRPNEYGNYYGNGNNGVNRPHGHGRPPNNNYGNGYGNYGQHPGHGHGYKPNKYPSHPHQENFDHFTNPTQDNDNHGYNNQNQGNYNNNNYNERPNQGNNNNYGHNKPNQGNNFSNKPNRPNQGNNNFNKPRPDQGFNDYGNQNNQGNPNINNGLKPLENGQLPTESVFTTKKPEATEKPEIDAPLFIPLPNPNLTESGGDKTNKDPKRETDDNDDDNFEIDIRIKDQ